jgi:drug/metabolite transporter (DMT)-like permease
LAFGVALFGFTLLTGLSAAQLGQGIDSHLMGNLIMLISLTGEASYSILGRKLTARHPPLPVFGSSLGFGVLFLGVLVPLFTSGQVFENHFTWRSILGLLWLGPLGTTVTYIYWIFVLRNFSVASLALTLFVQPVFGSLWGVIFLKERLTLIQSLGGAMIVLAVLGQALGDYFLQRRSRRAGRAPR